MGNLKLLTAPGSPVGRVLQHGDEFTRKDVEDGRLCYIGVNGLGISAINVREDSFSYTIGSGQNKRFGEISIRIEDFLLSRTGDPNLPGFEPVDGVGADRRNEEDSIFDPSVSQEVGSYFDVKKQTPKATRGTDLEWPDWSNWSVSIDKPKKAKTESKKSSWSISVDHSFSNKPKSDTPVTKSPAAAKSSKHDYYYYDNEDNPPDYRHYSTESPHPPLSGSFGSFNHVSFTDPVSQKSNSPTVAPIRLISPPVFCRIGLSPPAQKKKRKRAKPGPEYPFRFHPNAEPDVSLGTHA